MSASDTAGDMNVVNLITSGDESDESSDGLELNSRLKAGKSGAAASGTLDSFSRGLQGKASNRKTATASDGATAIDPSRGAASREEGGQIETTDSGSPQACRASGGRNDDDLTEKGKIVKEHVRKYGLVSAGPNTRHVIWKKGWFKLYSGKRRAEYAVCTLCVKQEDWNAAEVKYGTRKSTTNLINHLDTDERPGHRDRHNKLAGVTDIEAEGSIARFIKLNDPLPWWRDNCVNFPMVAALARKVLAIPATSAQSERLFSKAGQVVTNRRSSLGSENVELLLFLRTMWPVITATENNDRASRKRPRL